MRITRTYPQPDSPAPHLGPRERALGVFKYLLDLEPEAAVKHPLFACIVHAFEQHGTRCQDGDLEPSLTPELTGTREVVLPQTPIEGAGL